MIDSRAHHALLQSVVARGFAPAVGELAGELGVSEAEAEAALDRLAEGHGLVLHRGTHEVWIAHPFSLSPTAVWVAAGERGWWAPCLWCGFGVQALIGEDVELRVRLGGEREDATLHVRGGDVVERDLVAHFPMPPRRAWDNVVHFCASLLPFRSAADVDAWCARHRLPRGEVLPLPQLQALARRWYGGHLSPTWVKHTAAQAAAIFAEVGLTGPFWEIDATAARF